MSKSDMQLKQDIEAELLWDPKVNAAQIGVSVYEGSVSLLGTVDTYAEKWAAEEATKRVHGVRTVAHDLTVKLRTEHQHSDTEIAAAVRSAFKWNVLIPGAVTATVQRGTVTLAGQVTWNYQREAAERAVRYLSGVVTVYNHLTLASQPSSARVKVNIEAALGRQAALDAKSIEIATSGGKVTLTGSASSWRSIEDAANAAWAAPGVNQVDSQVNLSSTR